MKRPKKSKRGTQIVGETAVIITLVVLLFIVIVIAIMRNIAKLK